MKCALLIDLNITYMLHVITFCCLVYFMLPSLQPSKALRNRYFAIDCDSNDKENNGCVYPRQRNN